MLTRLLIITLSSFWLMAPAMAEVQINGFASVVTGIDLEDDGNPTNDYGSRTADNLQESKVALQWGADLGEGMRFVGQTMARGDSGDGFVLTYDWAYFDFNIGESGKLKLGRLRIPFYKYSDYLDVGYAYHWISPPKSMYSLTFSNMDGIGYQQNFATGMVDHSLNAVIGRYQGTLLLGGVASPGNLENLFAINYSANMGNQEFYIAYAQADVYLEAATVEGLATAAPAEADAILMNGDKGSFIGVGYKGSFSDITLFAEYSQVIVDDSILQDQTGGYIGAAYSMGEYVYHVTYEVEEDTGKDFTNPVVNAAAKALGNRSSEGDATTITFGVRKDIAATTALKAELSSYTEDRIQVAGATATSEQKALLLKIAVETMF